jgi:hypothetical protein
MQALPKFAAAGMVLSAMAPEGSLFSVGSAGSDTRSEQIGHQMRSRTGLRIRFVRALSPSIEQHRLVL